MRIPVIKIREQYGDKTIERLVGTDRHDVLSVEDGGIYYTDIHGMVGTKYPEESGMSFVTEDTEYSFTGDPEIKMVSVEEFLDIIEKQITEEVTNEIEQQKLFKKIFAVREAKREAERKLKDYDMKEGLRPHT